MLKATLNIFKKINLTAIFLAVITASLFMSSSTIASERKIKQSAQEKITVIDKYQEKYFELIKRNDYFLQTESNSVSKKEEKELKKLYKEVERQIKYKEGLKEYKKIKKLHSKCEEITTPGMNECAYNYYRDVDDLLNKTYNKVKAKISSKDFQNLVLSERKWLKEVNDYEKVFDSMEFGSIGTLIYYTYQIDMREFRTLLLMLYL